MTPGKLYHFEGTSPHTLYADRTCLKSIGLVPTKGIVIFLEASAMRYYDGNRSQLVKVIHEDQIGYLGLVIAEKHLPFFFTEAVNDPR